MLCGCVYLWLVQYQNRGVTKKFLLFLFQQISPKSRNKLDYVILFLIMQYFLLSSSSMWRDLCMKFSHRSNFVKGIRLIIHVRWFLLSFNDDTYKTFFVHLSDETTIPRANTPTGIELHDINVFSKDEHFWMVTLYKNF